MKVSAEFISSRAELAKLEPFTAQFAERAGLGPKDLFALQIVVEELVTNVIHHGGVPAGKPAATVELAVDSGDLVIVVTDCGREYNPLLRNDPDTSLPAELRSIGGLGIHFCKKLTDSQSYERVEGCNVLTLRKRLSG